MIAFHDSILADLSPMAHTAAVLCLFLAGLLILQPSQAARNLIPVPPSGYAYWGIHADAAWYDNDAQTQITNNEATVGRKFGMLSLIPARRPCLILWRRY